MLRQDIRALSELNNTMKEKDKRILEVQKESLKVKEDNRSELRELKKFKSKVLHEKKKADKQKKQQLKKDNKVDLCDNDIKEMKAPKKSGQI